MNAFQRLFEKVDPIIISWMQRWGITFVRLSLGIVFVWFGVLKFFPGMSPAEELVGQTVLRMTFGRVGPSVSMPVLALWETVIGLGFITGRAPRLTILLLYLQMPGTLMPLFFFPEATFTRFPFAPTLEGQYIIKNLVLISSAMVIGATVRGAKLRE